jgi:hypothetical protein
MSPVEYKDVRVPLGVRGRSPARPGITREKAVGRAALNAGPQTDQLITSAVRAESAAGWIPDEATDLPALLAADRVSWRQTGGILLSWEFTFDFVSIRFRRPLSPEGPLGIEGSLYPEDVSSSVLKELLDTARMKASVDADGRVRVDDNGTCYLHLSGDRRLISVSAIFGANPDAGRLPKLEYANRVNNQIEWVKASVTDEGGFLFGCSIPLDGGISKGAVALTARRYLDAVNMALQQDSGNVVQRAASADPASGMGGQAIHVPGPPGEQASPPSRAG